VNPQPTAEELRVFYSGYDDGDQWRKGEEYFNRGIKKAIKRIKLSGTVLDIGCGSGNFLRCMKEAGFSVSGIEPSASGSQFARTEHGLDIYHGMVEDYLAAHRARRFDVITLLNVLEHLTEPAQTLLRLRQILAPDGLLAIVVPDARFHDLAGKLRRGLGLRDPFWLEKSLPFVSGFKLPDHLCSFQPRTIVSLLQRCGFTVVARRNAPLVLNGSWHRNAAKFLVRNMSQLLYHLTFRRTVCGYSTLVLAKREPDWDRAS
jgi:SAM-dependent methyltransferase